MAWVVAQVRSTGHVQYEIGLQMVSLEIWQRCRLFRENQAQKPTRVLSPVGQRSWDVSWRWNTWAWREERAQAASECHNLEAIENTGRGEVHVAIAASCNISENAYTDDFRKEGDVMVRMAVHSLLFPEKAEGAIWKKNTSDKYILKGILSSVTLHSPKSFFWVLHCWERQAPWSPWEGTVSRAYCNIPMAGWNAKTQLPEVIFGNPECCGGVTCSPEALSTSEPSLASVA